MHTHIDYFASIFSFPMQCFLMFLFFFLLRLNKAVPGKNYGAKLHEMLQENTIETTGAGDTFGACALNYVLENGIIGSIF